MNKKYKVGLIVVTILLVSTIFIGLSYSLWSSTMTQSDTNLVETACFKIEFSESSNISMSNAYPISDRKGLTGTPYTFKVTNTCDLDSSLNIAINPLNSTTMSLDAIKTTIKSIGDYSTPKLLTDLKANTNYDTSKYSASYIIYTDTLYVGETKEYSILMWMDENATNKEMGTTFSSKIVVTNVADNKLNNDYVLAAFIDGQETTAFPSKADGYSFDHAECSDSNVVTKWDNSSWGLLISNVTQKTKCSVFFVSTNVYNDGVIASTPELYDGLIPVKYDSNGNVIVADTSKGWYDYANHEWANAVLVNRDLNKTYSVGSTIPMDDILQMYVWIPRYRYQLWNVDNSSSVEQAINIVFEDKNTAKSTGTKDGEWLTHPAFTFGSTELNGIWVGKFENSNGTLTNSTDLTNIQIKPNVVSMVYVNVSNMFNAVRNVELQYSSRYGLTQSSIDTHMMKNMEWGAVAYLTSSIYGRYKDASTCILSGCEVWINNTYTGTGCQSPWTVAECGGTVTGCSGASVSAGQDNNRTTCQSGYDWTKLGVNASTTGNIYGLYDMSGGAYEYVMGNMVNSSGGFYSSSAGFSTTPDSKYYDSYAYGDSYTEHNRGKLGDATRETLASYGSETGGWYNDYTYLPYGDAPWFKRGGHYIDGAHAGVFNFNRDYGYANAGGSFRSVLTAE